MSTNRTRNISDPTAEVLAVFVEHREEPQHGYGLHKRTGRNASTVRNILIRETERGLLREIEPEPGKRPGLLRRRYILPKEKVEEAKRLLAARKRSKAKRKRLPAKRRPRSAARRRSAMTVDAASRAFLDEILAWFSEGLRGGTVAFTGEVEVEKVSDDQSIGGRTYSILATVRLPD